MPLYSSEKKTKPRFLDKYERYVGGTRQSEFTTESLSFPAIKLPSASGGNIKVNLDDSGYSKKIVFAGKKIPSVAEGKSTKNKISNELATLPDIHFSGKYNKQEKTSCLPVTHNSSKLQKNLFLVRPISEVKKDWVTGSFYLECLSEDQRPPYVTLPLAKIADSDPTLTKQGDMISLYHGGFFKPQDVKLDGILPFKSTIEFFERIRAQNPQFSMSQYIEEAQLRRVNGSYEDPLYSCTKDPQQAFRFAPRVPTDNKLPTGVSEYIRSIYIGAENYNSPALSSTLSTFFWYEISKDREPILINFTVKWGPYSEKIVDKLVSAAAADLVSGVFGPKFGYVAAIKTERGHKVNYTTSMGDHGSVKQDYKDEKEFNIFGGIKGSEIVGFVPVWGEYMNPQNNFVVHSGGTGDVVLDQALEHQIKHNKHMLMAPRYGKLTGWRGLSERFAKQESFNTMINSLIGKYVGDDSFKVMVISGDNGKNIVHPEGADTIYCNGVTCDISFTVSNSDLKPGSYTLYPSPEYNDENQDELERFRKLAAHKARGLEQVKADVDSGIYKFIDGFDILSQVISRYIY
ncbi:hypothetical protein [Aeromonas jandaei]|uniref:hypothetical protein n=1 Tax=Aeromonas jandaei TaxID=650 RepID=UPI003B9E0AFE